MKRLIFTLVGIALACSVSEIAGSYQHIAMAASITQVIATSTTQGEDEISAKYASLGTSNGFLGSPTIEIWYTPDGVGRFQHYENGGSIYWTPRTGAHEVHGDIRAKWSNLDWERGFLGYPVTDELTTPDGEGRFNHFEYGSIYWTPRTGAHEVHGDIRAKWASLGYERSWLGYPITDELTTPDGEGRFNHFEYGSIYWTPRTGAHEVHGDIHAKWASLGYERSWLGYPITDELDLPGYSGGRYSQFEGGYIYWRASGGAVASKTLPSRPAPPTPPIPPTPPNTTLMTDRAVITKCGGMNCFYPDGAPIWYTGTFPPPIGTPKPANVLSIKSHIAMRFPITQASSDCNNTSKSFYVPRGGTLGPQQLRAIYGTETPGVRIGIIGCIAEIPSGGIPSQIFLDVTYRLQ
ncbi:hypothetical protein H6F90_02705 [Trichocoleus sp. FACHB-591]|uniref:LGFP repeat-containing protein n=1 Tax=Trichocoleus sp. FACHB-591 TaxID=2692872 RepID=UPI0016898911|nr:hypothetical protein [Trichocoleus sp. FACHB-591]MBD2094064.1 hypothetical protein [Trichocoleus sp. FACHB-591]